jgi:two-component system sensor histidine kinase HydH
MTLGKSIIRRYLILSVVASTLPVMVIGLLYDRLAGSALEQLLGEKVATHLAATTNRLGAFLEARRYQVESLASYPGIDGFAKLDEGDTAGQMHALLQIESDLPDLYGILFFDAGGKLIRAIPGQAASGPPYWADRPFETSQLPRSMLGDTEILGPMPPDKGDAGWLLIRHTLQGQRADQPIGYIALHVRLASLTEQLGAAGTGAALQPLLRTPAGDFNTVGQQVQARGRLITGPNVLPGWHPLLEVEATGVLRAFELERQLMLLAVLLGAALVVFLYFHLSRHLRKRVGVLLRGTEAVAAGRLDHRIVDAGDDEIASVSQAFNAMSAKLHESLERALRSERLAALGEFATGVAHEIRNPLTSLKTTVQALSRREPDARRQQLLADMEGEIDRLARVVNDLVDFGRPRPPKPVRVPVGDALKQISAMIDTEAAQRRVHVSWQGDAALAPYVDRDQLMQIVLNLALNAVQATPAGGSVVLRAYAEADKVVIEVSDTGCGIPPELLDRVSEPFVTTKPKGAGLGLSISRQLCELNGGQLSIASTPGQGTIVRILLPVEATHHADRPDR